MTLDSSSIFTEAWMQVIQDYTLGKIFLTNELSLELSFVEKCENIIQKNKLKIPIGRQKEFYGKRVDVWIGENTPDVVELKIYHDPADWKATKSSKNTVETDLNFAKGDAKIWVGVIDTIPSTNKQKIPFNLDWKYFKIDDNVFEKNYKNINPISSPSREKKQRYFFLNGNSL